MEITAAAAVDAVIIAEVYRDSKHTKTGRSFAAAKECARQNIKYGICTGITAALAGKLPNGRKILKRAVKSVILPSVLRKPKKY